MADETLKVDPDFVKVDGAVTDNVALEVRRLRVNPTTGALKVKAV
jgi:hypothetical protein|tara:strand:- start:221 stop:355 length:135 start_codon:yes stop_codon:yes gene_type:complete